MNKLKAIEGIRGVACLMVVFSHLSLAFFPYLHAFAGEPGSNNPIQYWIHNSPFGFIYSGSSAVYIFFVLSGYILTYVALKNNILKLVGMSLKRYPRLMIPVVISCVIAYASFLLPIEKVGWISKFGNFNYSFIGSIYSGLVESFLIGKSSYNPVLWTMQIELFGSFIIFSMCFIKLKYKYSSIYIDFCFIAIVLIMVGGKLLSEKLGSGLIAFIIGYLFYCYGRNIQPILSIPLFILGLYLAGTHNSSSSYSAITSILGSRSYIIGNFISGIIIVYSIIFNKNLNIFFSKKIFVFMGKVSFSVYLIHLPIISTFGVLCFNLLNKYFVYEASAVLSSIITIFLTYAMSIFYFNYIDHPGMIASNKFKDKILNSVSYAKTK